MPRKRRELSPQEQERLNGQIEEFQRKQHAAWRSSPRNDPVETIRLCREYVEHADLMKQEMLWYHAYPNWSAFVKHAMKSKALHVKRTRRLMRIVEAFVNNGIVFFEDRAKMMPILTGIPVDQMPAVVHRAREFAAAESNGHPPGIAKLLSCLRESAKQWRAEYTGPDIPPEEDERPTDGLGRVIEDEKLAETFARGGRLESLRRRANAITYEVNVLIGEDVGSALKPKVMAIRDHLKAVSGLLYSSKPFAQIPPKAKYLFSEEVANRGWLTKSEYRQIPENLRI